MSTYHLIKGSNVCCGLSVTASAAGAAAARRFGGAAASGRAAVRRRQLKKCLLVTPADHWPNVDSGISMRQIGRQHTMPALTAACDGTVSTALPNRMWCRFRLLRRRQQKQLLVQLQGLGAAGHQRQQQQLTQQVSRSPHTVSCQRCITCMLSTRCAISATKLCTVPASEGGTAWNDGVATAAAALPQALVPTAPLKLLIAGPPTTVLLSECLIRHRPVMTPMLWRLCCISSPIMLTACWQ
eukprot:GHUV01050467.1.p1 GENE.GHUV01050467.1~~GHUV01050467.1.p1  ORF type:complete len:241 (+),score=61.61 GHUV01050467.1:474-1196(+)